MPRRHAHPLCCVLLVCLLPIALSETASAAARKIAKPTPSLQPFEDEAAFAAQVAEWRQQVAASQRHARRDATSADIAPPAPSAPAPAAAPQAASFSAMPTDAAAESITNVQTAGVDEGGIVKRHGDHLVVLRRGRLFTVRIGGDDLQPVAAVDAFAPGSAPGGAWYDEMLIGRDTVVVVGYSYARGGTELVLFDIDRAGALAYRDTWHLRSNDYYSARNFASRLVDDTLVFYTPMRLDLHAGNPASALPAMRRWQRNAELPAFRRILPATRIYRSDAPLDPLRDGMTLHTVTRCDLSRRELDCTSSAVLGPSGRVFYVSADSVFVWTTAAGRDARNTASAFRMPLDGRAPTGLKTEGVPIDQMSFLQDADHLNVLVGARGRGEGMWGARTHAGDLALLRVPLAHFGDGSGSAPPSAYRPLPGSADGTLQNRFIGDWLVYGTAPHRRRRTDHHADGAVHALRYAAHGPIDTLTLAHGVERVEALGRDAVLVGSAGADLHFTSLRLRTQADIASTHVQGNAAQGDSRTHGFFYRAQSAERGIVGLPVIGGAHGRSAAASVLYLRNQALALSPMGRLDARPEQDFDDACVASCVDWYGNARPIFIGDRVFALLGYELVEGRIAQARIVERRRTRFAPGVAIAH